MLYQIRNGSCNPGPKLIRKIEAIENKEVPHSDTTQHPSVEPPPQKHSLEEPERSYQIKASPVIQRMSDEELDQQFRKYADRVLAQTGYDRVKSGLAVIELADEIISRSQFPKLSEPPPPTAPPDPGPLEPEK